MMNTLEILNKLEYIACSKPDVLHSFDWRDVEQCLVSEINCIKECYPASEYDRLTGLISALCQQASESNSTPTTLLNLIAELKGIAEALPLSADNNPLLQQAAFDHAALMHYKNKSTVVLGDSHVNFFSGNERLTFSSIGHGINLCPQVNNLNLTVLYLGSGLAYSCLKPDSRTQFSEKLAFLKKEFIRPGAGIILSLGEIDIRLHILKQSERQGVDIEIIIDQILANYSQLIENLLSEGYHVGCWGPIASQKDNSPADPAFPRYGTERQRNRITVLFNRQLEQICHKLGADFLSILDGMIDKNLDTKEEFLSSDHFHLSQSAMSLAMPYLKNY